MPERKTIGLSLRVSPQMRELMNRAAETDNRSVTQLIEILVLKFAQERGIELPKVSTQRKGKTKT
jgi:uncharacterized protein (DUF1778 family)